MGLVLGVTGILLVIFVPWIYGRLIKWFYEQFNLHDY
jgi:hypothetical protein